MIGASIATLCTGNGYKTTMLATGPSSAEKGQKNYDTNYQDLIKQGLITEEQYETCKKLLTITQSFEDLEDVDFVYECNLPLVELLAAEPSEKDITIGNYIADMIEDGSTLQLGIGGIPNAVAKSLKNKKDLGIHTEMFTDGMVDLYNLGVITNRRKTINKNKFIASFALGTKKLYDFIDNNLCVEFKSAAYTNDPYIIGQNYKMVSVNTSIQVDLTGQCCSESIGHVQYSGTGGQADTATGSQNSIGGKSIIALYSTAKGDSISTIVPFLNVGATVTLSRTDVDHIVTEYGVASLRGRSIRERVKELIKIAHPNFREELKREAEKYNIW
jgi:acyl-CoA hydrolase